MNFSPYSKGVCPPKTLPATSVSADRYAAGDSKRSLSQGLPTRRHFQPRRTRGNPGSSPISAAGSNDLDQDAFDLEALLGDMDMPMIDGDLQSRMDEAGAIFSDEGLVTSFGNDAEALDAIKTGAVIFDRSHWGRLRLVGDDRVRFMHNQSTADFEALSVGQGCETVFVTNTGRTLELSTAYIQGSSIMVVITPEMKDDMLTLLDKYIFPMDKVEVMDASEQCCMLSLHGLIADDLLIRMQAEDLVGSPLGTHRLLNFKGSPVMVAVGGGLPGPGYTFITDEDGVADLWGTLVDMGATPAGEDTWERLRVLTGVPKPGAELTEDYNALEAGLYSAVSLEKGCYIGQETLAKVHGNNAVLKQLWGIKLEGAADAGTELTSDGKKVGVLTSVTEVPSAAVADREGQYFGLGYVKCRTGGAQVDVEGMSVDAGGVKGMVIPINGVTHKFADQLEGTGAEAEKTDEGMTEKEAEAKAAKEKEDAAAAKAKAKKREAMKAQLAAYLESQGQSADVLDED